MSTRHALITGASSGIGAALAKHFAAQGWRLTLAARREAELEALAASLNVECFVRPTDLNDLSQCKQLIDDATARMGPIDMLINNAGVQYVEPTVEVSPERVERLMTVDLLAPLRLIHYVLPTMLERDQGHIINIASLAGLIFTPGMCHYNAAKAGLAAASESLRVELKATNLHILTVYPGPVHSDMEAKAREAFEATPLMDKLPTGTAQELARLIDQAMVARKERVVYPKIYNFSRHTRVLSQWVTDKLSPPLKNS